MSDFEVKVTGRHYSASCVIDGTPVDVWSDVLATDPASVARALFSKRLGLALDRRDEARELSADRFLATYNETWRSRGAPVLTRDAFIRGLTLKRIFAYEDRLVTLYFTSNGLFGGHLVTMSFYEDGRPLGTPDLQG